MVKRKLNINDEMLEIIRENQPISIWDIMEKLNEKGQDKVSYGSVHYHLTRMKEKIIFKSVSDGSVTKVMVSLK